MRFKELLKDELTYKGIQTKELAAKTGISLSTLNHYLAQNGNAPSAENAYKIAQVLGVSVEYLMTGKNADISTDIKQQVKELIPELNYLDEKDLSLIKEIIARLKKE
ncbi:MAG: helix-turn-helix transcriptional regulator [Treponema sp.]|nr:helix-turn-helix transcriptional regulator [Treponema sp.]